MKAKNQFVRVSLIALIASLWINISFAQPAFPQKTITVTPTQSIHFGTLSTFGSGGTVVVGWDGSRTSTGDIVLIPISPVAQPAIFEIKL